MKNKITVKEYIVISFFILFALMIMFLAIRKIVSYAEYKEERFYKLEELKPGTYAIYNIVFSTVPSHNYETITICCEGQILVFEGTVSIFKTNDRPYAKVISRPHVEHGDDVIIYIPNGGIEYSECIATR